jgi:hypothetical protein
VSPHPSTWDFSETPLTERPRRYYRHCDFTEDLETPTVFCRACDYFVPATAFMPSREDFEILRRQQRAGDYFAPKFYRFDDPEISPNLLDVLKPRPLPHGRARNTRCAGHTAHLFEGKLVIHETPTGCHATGDCRVEDDELTRGLEGFVRMLQLWKRYPNEPLFREAAVATIDVVMTGLERLFAMPERKPAGKRLAAALEAVRALHPRFAPTVDYALTGYHPLLRDEATP